MKVFIDSSALFAYFVESDDFHKNAVSFLAEKPELITSTVVLHETIALFAKRISKTIAKKVGSFVFEEEIITLIVPSNKEERESWELYRTSKRSKMSWVDYNNVTVMKNLGIKEIFTFDEDFRKLGLRIVP